VGSARAVVASAAEEATVTSYVAWMAWTVAVVGLGIGFVVFTRLAAARAVEEVVRALGAVRVAEAPRLWAATVRGRTVRLGFLEVSAAHAASPGWTGAGVALTVIGGALGGAVDGRDAIEAVEGATVRQLVVAAACRNSAHVDVVKMAGGFVNEGNMGQLDAAFLKRLFALRVRAHEVFETAVDEVRFRMDTGFLRVVRAPWLRAWIDVCVDAAEAVERAAAWRPSDPTR
jgi:hypothetical protein